MLSASRQSGEGEGAVHHHLFLGGDTCVYDEPWKSVLSPESKQGCPSSGCALMEYKQSLDCLQARKGCYG